MRRRLLAVGAVVLCGCGGDAFVGGIPDGSTDGGGGGDGGGGDAATCLAQEVCGNGLDDDCNGTPDDGCQGLGTYVSTASGADTNPGTQKSPAKTIAQGIANAQKIGGIRTVYVAAGNYPEKITLVEGISLEGGYQCDAMTCSWTRDLAKNDTAILNPDFEGVVAPATITRQTHLDGFRVQGMDGAPTTQPGSTAIRVLGSPTITQNRIVGGNVTGGNASRSSGVAILAPITDPAGPLVANNDIQGGVGGAFTSVGVLFDQVPGAPPGSLSYGVVRGNRIKGGNATNTTGVAAWSAAGQSSLVGNTISSGASAGSGGNGSSWAVSVGGTLLVEGNLINTDQSTVGGCTTTGFCGGLVSYSSTSTIVNNVIYGSKSPRSVAVYLLEAEKPAGVVILNGNLLDGAGNMPGVSPTSSSAITFRINTGNNALAIGRIRNNVLLGGIAQFRYGLYEDQPPNKTNKPDKLENNQFHFAPAMGRTDVIWHQWSGTMATDVTAPPPLNQAGDPMVDATWHLLQGSPCIDKGTATEAPAKDRDGQARPMGGGIDIGPDER